MNASFQLILLPGLGADERLLWPQRRAFPQLIVPPWIPPRRKESLPGYADRMAETVAPRSGMPLVLGGVSFGGMLAYEMARRLKPDAVVLIASCRTRRGLRPLFRAGCRLLPLLPPAAAWSVPKLLAGPAMRLRRHTPAAQRTLLVEMFNDMDPRFMHWVVQAIPAWRPAPLAGVPVRHIHGRRDRLIPARRVQADEYIPGGGHLINLTHANRVNDFIIKAAAMSQQILAFQRDAVAYCELMDSLKQGKPERFYQRLITCLSRLAKSADELPDDYAISNVENDGREITHEEWKEIAQQIGGVVDPEIHRLVEEAPDDPKTVNGVCMFWDDLADIYRELHDGLRLFNLGEDGIKEAIWQWKFGFKHHWGLHLFDALHTAHRIKYELHEE